MKLWLEALLSVSLPPRHWHRCWNSYTHKKVTFFYVEICIQTHCMKTCIALWSTFVKCQNTISFTKKIQINKEIETVAHFLQNASSWTKTSPTEDVQGFRFAPLRRPSAYWFWTWALLFSSSFISFMNIYRTFPVPLYFLSYIRSLV